MSRKKSPQLKSLPETKSPKSKKTFWEWVKSNTPAISFTTILAVILAYHTYVTTGADSLRTDIYQPLYREIGVMDTVIHSNNMETNYSGDVYETLTRNGNLDRIRLC